MGTDGKTKVLGENPVPEQLYPSTNLTWTALELNPVIA